MGCDLGAEGGLMEGWQVDAMLVWVDVRKACK
jgi:hypothetical protein